MNQHRFHTLASDHHTSEVQESYGSEHTERLPLAHREHLRADKPPNLQSAAGTKNQHRFHTQASDHHTSEVQESYGIEHTERLPLAHGEHLRVHNPPNLQSAAGTNNQHRFHTQPSDHHTSEVQESYGIEHTERLPLAHREHLRADNPPNLQPAAGAKNQHRFHTQSSDHQTIEVPE
jgi:hypothetical protein